MTAPVNNRKRRNRRLVAFVGALIFSVVLAEVVLQVLGLPKSGEPFLSVSYGDEEFVPDRTRFWRLSPDCESYLTNEAGLRGWWPDRSKLGNETRILCVGDSCTFGHGVRCEDAYGMRIERQLQQQFPGAVVRSVLGALPGYSTHQNLALLREHAAELQPDLTVLYCGAWNDFVPAVLHNDDEQARQRSGLRGWSRVAQLLDRSVAASEKPLSREALQAAFRDGVVPYGRRVPLDHYRRNMEALIQSAKDCGSTVLVVVPPLPADTLANFPVALEYRNTTLEVAAAAAVSIFDAPEAVDDFVAGCDVPWRTRMDGGPVCFRDRVHPSALGHRVLATAIVQHMLAERLLPDALTSQRDAASSSLQIVDEHEIRSLAGGAVELQGEALADAVALERIWVGRHWIRSWQRVEQDRIRIQLPDYVEPGRHCITLCTSRGVVVASSELEVEPLELQLSVGRDERGINLAMELRGPPGWSGCVWLSDRVREQPVSTFGGLLYLAAEPDGRPAERDDLPFRFDLMRLPAFVGRIPPSGVWSLERHIAHDPSKPIDHLFVQGGVQSNDVDDLGAMTALIERPVPK